MRGETLRRAERNKRAGRGAGSTGESLSADEHRHAAHARSGGVPVSWRSPYVIPALAFVAAFLERWWFSHAWNEAGSLTSAFYYGDAQRLVEYAIAIAQGRPFDNGIPYHPPGWPILLAAFFKVFGVASAGNVIVPVTAVKALLAAISAASVAVATLLAFEIAGFTAMVVVAFLGTFHFGHIVEGTVADTEALYGLCVVIAVFATLRAIGSRSDTKRVAWAGVAGAIGGYAMLVRAEFVACAFVLIAAIVLARREAWRTQITAFIALYFVVLVPTTVWHWRSLSAFNASHVGRVAGPLPTFAPVTSYGPFNFAMANHENADGGPNRDHPLLDRCNEETTGRLDVGQLDLACPEVLDLYVHGYRIGLGWLAGHPVDAASLVGRKIAMSIGFLAHGYLIDDVGAGVDGTRRRVDLVDPDSRALIVVHLALLLGGVWFLRHERLALLILLAPLVALIASTVLFYGYVRLGTGYLPVVWVFEAAAIQAITTGTRHARAERRSTAPQVRGGSADTQVRPCITRRQMRGAVAAILVMAVLLTIEWLRIDKPREVALDGPRTDQGILVQDETLEVRRLK